jgi:NAD(P)-dependent dehydrogenase (short-subunit alcohol dehydrogenase family)
MRGLDGKTLVVAGGATGIGRGVAVRLGQEGAKVVLGDLDGDGANRVAAEITEAGGTAIGVQFDIGHNDSVTGLIESAVAEFGTVHGLYNCAADTSLETIGGDTHLLDADLDIWRRTYEINLLGFVRTCKAVLPILLGNGGGAIVNTSSAAASLGEPTRPAYAASKAGINTLTRHIASTWGKQGVRCNSVAPGIVLTEKLKENPPQEFLDWAGSLVRSPRLGETSDIGATVAFLLSDDAEWVNGQVWRVDGGHEFRD